MFELHTQLDADTIILGDLPLCRILLMNDSQYPWIILVPRRNNIQEIYQLPQADRRDLEHESYTLSGLLMNHFDGDKLNVATLGNMVPQLHIHHIVRFTSDPAWPKPVWGALPSTPYSEAALAKQVEDLVSVIRRKFDLRAC